MDVEFTFIIDWIILKYRTAQNVALHLHWRQGSAFWDKTIATH